MHFFINGDNRKVDRHWKRTSIYTVGLRTSLITCKKGDKTATEGTTGIFGVLREKGNTADLIRDEKCFRLN